MARVLDSRTVKGKMATVLDSKAVKGKMARCHIPRHLLRIEARAMSTNCTDIGGHLGPGDSDQNNPIEL